MQHDAWGSRAHSSAHQFSPRSSPQEPRPRLFCPRTLQGTNRAYKDTTPGKDEARERQMMRGSVRLITTIKQRQEIAGKDTDTHTRTCAEEIEKKRRKEESAVSRATDVVCAHSNTTHQFSPPSSPRSSPQEPRQLFRRILRGGKRAVDVS
jgi:hypothetical protein